jgi:hypothetical protein
MQEMPNRSELYLPLLQLLATTAAIVTDRAVGNFHSGIVILIRHRTGVKDG